MKVSDDTREKHPPKHCPGCASENITYVLLMSNTRGNLIWDTYCDDCNWSGDIRPDSDLDYYREDIIKERDEPLPTVKNIQDLGYVKLTQRVRQV